MFPHLSLVLTKSLLHYRRMDTFSALADPTRRTILDMLRRNGSLCATDIYRGFKVSPPAISQHLKVLHTAKLVRVEKRAQQRIYALEAEPLRDLERWVREFTAEVDNRFQRLDAVLKTEKPRLIESPTQENA